MVIRDTREAALAREAELLAYNGGAVDDEVRPGSAGVDSDRIIAGNPDEVFEQMKPYVEAGYRHLICGFPPPYDEETMRRMATEVRPRLEAPRSSRRLATDTPQIRAPDKRRPLACARALGPAA